MVKNEQKISTKVTITIIDINIRNKKHNSENMIIYIIKQQQYVKEKP